MMSIKNPHKTGLSLLEVIISLAIISMMLTPLLVMHTSSLRRTHQDSATILETIAQYNAMSLLDRTHLNSPFAQQLSVQDYTYQTQEFGHDSLLFGKNLVYASLTAVKGSPYVAGIDYIRLTIKKDHE